MGFSSQAGHLLVRSQTTAGTIEPDLATAGVSIKVTGGSLAPNRTLMISDPEIGGGRDVGDAYLGAVSWAGSYDFYARMDSLTTILKAALGTASPTGPGTGATAGVYTDTFTPSDAAQLPFLSIEEEIGSGLECYDYYDAVVNTLHLEAEANGYLLGTMGLIAKHQTAGITPTDTTSLVDTSPLIVGTNITVTYNSVALPAKSFKFDMTNQFDDSDFHLGTFYLQDLTPKRREITVGFTIRPQDSTLWRQAVYGLSTATTPGGITTKNALVITCSTYELISTSTVARQIVITIPKFALKPFSFAPKGDDVIDVDIEGEALRLSGSAIMTIVTKSGAVIA